MFKDGYNELDPGYYTTGCDCPYCPGDCVDLPYFGPRKRVYWWQWWGTTLGEIAGFQALPAMEQLIVRIARSSYPPLTHDRPPLNGEVCGLADWIPKTNPTDRERYGAAIITSPKRSTDGDLIEVRIRSPAPCHDFIGWNGVISDWTEEDEKKRLEEDDK